MILIKTAWNIFRKNFMMNLFTILQMTAVLVITAVMVSSVCIRYQYYTPFKDYFSSNGIFMDWTFYANSDPSRYAFNDMMNNEDFLEEFPEAKGMLSCHSAMMYCSEDTEKLFHAWSYDDELIKRFEPELQEGRWLSITTDPRTVEVVVSENEYGWEVGDTIELAAASFPNDMPFTAKVVGKLREGAKIPGGFFLLEGEPDFNNFYYPYTYEIEQQPALLFSYTALYHLDSGLAKETERDVSQGVISSAFLTFPDDFTEEELFAAQQKLNQYGNVMSFPMSEINENSKKYLHRELYNLLPIIIVLFILAAVSSVSSSALSTRRRLKDYAIYYITGLQWKHCTLVNLIQSVVISAISAVAASAILFAIPYTAYKDTFKIIWNPYLFAAMGGLVLLYFIISMMMPVIIIGRSSPKQILTR
ncbi:MAG: hypothetical protein IJ496_08060 [Ruminococcus sp.]|nr:hypothetical protein [Ruminococcus sp.]